MITAVFSPAGDHGFRYISSFRSCFVQFLSFLYQSTVLIYGIHESLSHLRFVGGGVLIYGIHESLSHLRFVGGGVLIYGIHESLSHLRFVGGGVLIYGIHESLIYVLPELFLCIRTQHE